eukprot:SAG22_NODE_831_length_6940_cov_12.139599_5_plen_283_part_00
MLVRVHPSAGSQTDDCLALPGLACRRLLAFLLARRLQIYKDELKNTMQLMGVTSVEQIRAEGLDLIDASSLSNHIEPSPNDYMRLPTVNVLTHGLPEGQAAAGPFALPSGALSEMPVTTTTTTTEARPDGTIVTNSVTTTGPPAAAAALPASEALAGGLVPTVIELHGYQQEFLGRAAAEQGLGGGASAALQKLVDHVMAEPAVAAAIFEDGFNCVHCDSKSPPDWIQNNKGEKLPYDMALSAAAVEFLGREMLLSVGPPGPDKASRDSRTATTRAAGRAAA